jgi:Leucine-rich repeat (LRR) protein
MTFIPKYLFFLLTLSSIIKYYQSAVKKTYNNTYYFTGSNSVSLISSDYEISSSEYTALYDLYTSTDGPQWNWVNVSEYSVPWNFTIYDLSAPCSNYWQGLSCGECSGSSTSTDPLQCHILELSLSSHNLSGTLPSSIGALNHLIEITLNTNNLTGTLPISLTNLTALQILDLHSNALSGTIPHEIGSLTRLNNLDLRVNKLNGTLPSSLYNLTYLNLLQLDLNHFDGTISSSLGNLQNLQLLTIFHNEMIGPIPSSIGQLTKLQFFKISVNYFTFLPKELYTLTNLTLFDISANLFEGTLPSEIGNLSSLVTLYVYSNLYYGQLPETLFNSQMPLQSISLESNLFSGTLSSAFGVWKSCLQSIYLADNSFTGTIPSNFSDYHIIIASEFNNNFFYGSIETIYSNITDISYLNFGENLFDGNIPNGNWPVLTFYLISDNYFVSSSSLPSNLSLSKILYFFDLSYNYLITTIPSWFSKKELLTYFNISHNFFYSNINGTFENTISLVQLSLSYNELTGTIPSRLGDLTNLNYFLLNNNAFTGFIPDSLKKLNHLKVLFLNNNQLIGTLADISKWQSLANVDVSNNILTGTLPMLSGSSSLSTFAAGSNCFHGSIPAFICNVTSVTVLSLDGLSTASPCRSLIFPYSSSASSSSSLFNAFTLENSFIDGIPPCLFSMPNLQTLHLSGNGLTGSLPSSYEEGSGFYGISSSLTDVALSHNRLSGTIPYSFQQRSWSNLDLSYNKFTGTLTSSFASYNNGNESLALQINRLSGSIPSSLLSAPNIQIVDGNMFTCNYNKDDLPSHDQDTEDYSCGSDVVNAALYTWIGAFSMFLLIFFCSLYYGSSSSSFSSFLTSCSCPSTSSNDGSQPTFLSRLISFLSEIMTWRDTYQRYGNRPILTLTTKKESFSRIPKLYHFLYHIRYLFRNLTIFIICLLMPIYCIISSIYHDFSFTYVWSVSAILLTGKVPAIILMFFFFLILCYFIYLFKVEISQRKMIEEREYQQRRMDSSLEGKDDLEGGGGGGVGGGVDGEGGSSGNHSNSMIRSFLHRHLSPPPPQSSLISLPFPQFGNNNNSSIFQQQSSLNEEEDGGGEEETSALAKLRRRSSIRDQPSFLNRITLLTVGLINCSLMIAADISYVYIITNFNTVIVIIAEIMLAVLKLFLNNSFLWVAIPNIRNFYSYYFFEKSLPSSSQQEKGEAPANSTNNTNTAARPSSLRRASLFRLTLFSQTTFATDNNTRSNPFYKQRSYYQLTITDISFLSFTILLNNLVFPALAILVVSPNCFYYAIFSAPSVTLTYTYQICSRYSFIPVFCYEEAIDTVTSSYDPPFFYDFECSSMIIINYAAVFIIMYVFEGIIHPFFKLGAKFLYDSFQLSQYDEKVAVGSSSKSHDSLPRSTNRDDSDNSGNSNDQNENADKERTRSATKERATSVNTVATQIAPNNKKSIWNSIYFRLVIFFLPDNLRPLLPEPTKEMKYTLILFQKSRLAVRISSYLAVFMTFGVLFPPLAFVTAFTLYSVTFYEEIIIGRILTEAERTENHWYRKQIDRNCSGISNSLKYSLWTLIPVSCLLYSYIIFDTWGDEKGWRSALVPAVIMFIFPVLTLFMISRIKKLIKLLTVPMEPITSSPRKTTVAVERESQVALSEVKRPGVSEAALRRSSPFTSVKVQTEETKNGTIISSSIESKNPLHDDSC